MVRAGEVVPELPWTSSPVLWRIQDWMRSTTGSRSGVISRCLVNEAFDGMRQVIADFFALALPGSTCLFGRHLVCRSWARSGAHFV